MNTTWISKEYAIARQDDGSVSLYKKSSHVLVRIKADDIQLVIDGLTGDTQLEYTEVPVTVGFLKSIDDVVGKLKIAKHALPPGYCLVPAHTEGADGNLTLREVSVVPVKPLPEEQAFLESLGPSGEPRYE